MGNICWIYELLKYRNSIIVNDCRITSKKNFKKDNDKIKELYIKDIIDLYLNFNKGEFMNSRNKFMREKFGNIINIIEEK